MKNYLKRPLFLATAGIVTAFAGCDKNDKPGTTDASPKLENRSVTPALIKKLGGFENLELFTLIEAMMSCQTIALPARPMAPA
ncbi:MAG TPA: hypothetical protein VEY10_20510 [Flavisolibacter sp.]|nr:hypothetical protein [Flavisolibacter sp.]